MRIAFVNDTFLEGRGADTVIYELARRLGQKHEVFVITAETDMPEENFKILKINAKKLLTENLIRDSLSYFPNIFRFRKEISKLHQKYNFDIFNVHHSSLNLAFMGLRTIVTWHGSPPTKNIARKRWNKFILKSLKKNKVSIAISNFMKKGLSRIIPDYRIKVNYNGVSSEFKPKTKKTDKGYMLYVGRLEEHKFVHELVRLSKETSSTLNVIGSGPLENRLKNFAKKIKADKVEFLGKVSRKDLIKQYQECSFLISASKWEGFGLIFLEAAACAKPSIGYNRGGIPEVIKDKETGFVVKNYLELKEKAERLIKDKKLRKSMGNLALKHSKNFSWERSSKEYEKIFEEVKRANLWKIIIKYRKVKKRNSSGDSIY